MNNFQKGFSQVAVGIIGGVIISALLSGFAKDGLIPSNMVFLFTLVGFLGAIVLMFSYLTTGVIFTLGWIVGAWILKDMLSIFDFIIYFVAPIIAFILRIIIYFKK